MFMQQKTMKLHENVTFQRFSNADSIIVTATSWEIMQEDFPGSSSSSKCLFKITNDDYLFMHFLNLGPQSYQHKEILINEN